MVLPNGALVLLTDDFVVAVVVDVKLPVAGRLVKLVALTLISVDEGAKVTLWLEVGMKGVIVKLRVLPDDCGTPVEPVGLVEVSFDMVKGVVLVGNPEAEVDTEALPVTFAEPVMPSEEDDSETEVVSLATLL